MRNTRVSVSIAAGIVACWVAVALIGCGGGGGTPTPTGGTITGTVVDAATGVGLGGVLVEVGNLLNPGVTSSFVAAASSTSVTPGGTFTISGIPVGSYSYIRVTPVPALGFPTQPLVVLSPPITLATGATVPLSGPILIRDEPPAPSG